MGIEKRTTTIDGHTYTLTLFGAKEGQRVLLRLAKILGPAAAEIVTRGDEGAAAAIQMALGTAADADLEFLTDSFCARCDLVYTMTTGAGPRPTPTPLKTQYDEHFAQRYMALGEWLFWCIQENFADFFGDKGIGGFVKKRQAELASQSTSPPTQTGSSGGS